MGIGNKKNHEQIRKCFIGTLYGKLQTIQKSGINPADAIKRHRNRRREHRKSGETSSQDA